MRHQGQSYSAHLQAVAQLVIHYAGMWPKSQESGVMYWNGERVTIEEFAELAGGLRFFDDTNN